MAPERGHLCHIDIFRVYPADSGRLLPDCKDYAVDPSLEWAHLSKDILLSAQQLNNIDCLNAE